MQSETDICKFESVPEELRSQEDRNEIVAINNLTYFN